MATRILVTSGPSLYSFSNALFDGEIVQNRPLKFTIEPAHVGPSGLCVTNFSITLNGVDMEDGSRKRWLFRGYGTDWQKGQKVHGYYDTESRRGWIEIVD